VESLEKELEVAIEDEDFAKCGEINGKLEALNAKKAKAVNLLG
jgi:hypothetical protein